MIGVDTNVLVYAHRRDSNYYDLASSRIKDLAEGASPWAIPWPCIHEFFSVVTNARVFQPPSAPPEAATQIDAWLESPSLVLLSETDQHWPELRALVMAGNISGGRVHDARIAAVCRQHGVRELWSADRDFSRFPGLRTVNPLIT